MSLNVCTDQLAMLLARPGQLVSVSALAADPHLAFHHELAEGIPKNRGLAEEVFVVKPDLVVTGTYSLHNTTQLLRRLGFRVEEFAYAQTIDSIPAEIRRMGKLLGNEQRGEAMAAGFERAVADIEGAACGPAPTAIAYDQNGIAMGSGTLVDSAMRAAGLRNLAAELGYTGMTPMPLELLIEHRPDIVVLSEPIAEAPALADQIMRHPALRALDDDTLQISLPQASASCGGPFVIEAVKALAAARRQVASCPKNGANAYGGDHPLRPPEFLSKGGPPPPSRGRRAENSASLPPLDGEGAARSAAGGVKSFARAAEAEPSQ